jgi:p-cumate 2,3-dioxygenase beta subunit
MNTRTKSNAAPDAASVTRAEVEEFLYTEAAMLDDWQLDEWLALLTADATYHVPSNDRPESNPRGALFTIADDIHRIRARVKRLKDVNAHAESPRSRTRRMIANVRILHAADGRLHVTANFIVNRFRRGSPKREYVGHYHYTLVPTPQGLRIAARRAVLDSTELGELGAVSFIL